MPADRLVPVPAGITDQEAAAMMLKGMTAWYLIRRTHVVKPGETILIHAAAGGVGLIVCQWAKHLGATVIGTVGDDEKAALAKQPKVSGSGAPVQLARSLARVFDQAQKLAEKAGDSFVPVEELLLLHFCKVLFDKPCTSLRQRSSNLAAEAGVADRCPRRHQFAVEPGRTIVVNKRFQRDWREDLYSQRQVIRERWSHTVRDFWNSLPATLLVGLTEAIMLLKNAPSWPARPDPDNCPFLDGAIWGTFAGVDMMAPSVKTIDDEKAPMRDLVRQAARQYATGHGKGRFKTMNHLIGARSPETCSGEAPFHRTKGLPLLTKPAERGFGERVGAVELA